MLYNNTSLYTVYSYIFGDNLQWKPCTQQLKNTNGYGTLELYLFARNTKHNWLHIQYFLLRQNIVTGSISY